MKNILFILMAIISLSIFSCQDSNDFDNLKIEDLENPSNEGSNDGGTGGHNPPFGSD